MWLDEAVVDRVNVDRPAGPSAIQVCAREDGLADPLLVETEDEAMTTGVLGILARGGQAVQICSRQRSSRRFPPRNLDSWDVASTRVLFGPSAMALLGFSSDVVSLPVMYNCVPGYSLLKREHICDNIS